ncbi:BTAD domain-containing putative transcriptional regulator [Nocardioides sp.]|uniref:BTAD domain-containing putative transcriptional regulator n=1 Tax=Nocardioides sp. TaxID=35761 RepID=UPI0031FF444D
MEVAVLGPVEVQMSGSVVDLGTPKQRALVAALALSRGRAVPVDTIVDLLWGETAPPGVTATLQAYVSGLRRVLEPGRERRAPASVLVTVAPGYALRVPDDAIDARLFEEAVGAEHRRLQVLAGPRPSPLSTADLTEAVERLDATLARWRGLPYGELGDAAAAVAERARLEELRLVALEDRAVAGLALGHHRTVSAELEALIAAHPLRERLWALWALALTRSGRQADALDVLRRLREVLDEELGLEPSAELRELQTAVLRQDVGLDWVPPEAAAAPASSAPRVERPDLPPVTEPVAPWPMVGRETQLAALRSALGEAEAGTPAYVVLTGEPGIGKSRLAAELVTEARGRGHRVLVGRCSQDDGAPPLWPWSTILGSLGQSLEPDLEALDEGGQFRSWERITRTIRDVAGAQVTVVVLDDLHWADTSTLRVLRLLAETATDERLLVLATWRPHPEPTGSLADVAEALARRHAVRLELAGLSAQGVAEIFATVADNPLSGEQARDLRERTDGNPFFLVEYARLAGARTDLDGLLSEDNPPTAVSEVLTRRLARLPDDTVAALRVAAVIGRQFDTPTLAAVTGIDEDDLLDVVEPAQAAGLVREDGIDRYLFAHALVRDTLRGAMSASRRARAHAKVARTLADSAGRETEVALHWLAAGPSFASQAWHAAVTAAQVAKGLHAYDEVVELLRAALESLEDDPKATPRDRYDVLMALTEAYRWSALLPDLVGCVEQAIAVGKELGDSEAVARAAIATTKGALWRSAPPGQTNEVVIDALRGSLDRLPGSDGELRCQSMLALANELDFSSSFEELRALVDEGLAMARRLDDPRLLLDACQIAFVSLWVPATAVERYALATEAAALATQVGDERGFVVSSSLRTVVLGELGRRRDMLEAAEVARAAAQRLRIAYGEMVLDSAELPWQAMAGRFDRCEELIERVRTVAGRISHNFGDEALSGAMIAYRLWDGRALEALPVLEEMNGELYPFTTTITVHLWRGGERERARAWHAEHGAPLEAKDGMLLLLMWCHAAEAALYLGDAELAGAVYALLAAYAGRSCSVGSSLACGPVDAYLALAAAATGERAIAAGHAEDALVLAGEWDIPLFGRWLGELRETYSF